MKLVKNRGYDADSRSSCGIKEVRSRGDRRLTIHRRRYHITIGEKKTASKRPKMTYCSYQDKILPLHRILKFSIMLLSLASRTVTFGSVAKILKSSGFCTRQREFPRRSPLIHSAKRMVCPVKSLTNGFARLTRRSTGLRSRTSPTMSLCSNHQDEGGTSQIRRVYRLQYRPAMAFIFARTCFR